MAYFTFARQRLAVSGVVAAVDIHDVPATDDPAVSDGLQSLESPKRPFLC